MRREGSFFLITLSLSLLSAAAAAAIIALAYRPGKRERPTDRKGKEKTARKERKEDAAGEERRQEREPNVQELKAELEETKKKVAAYAVELQSVEQKRIQERAGRISAERELSSVLQRHLSLSSPGQILVQQLGRVRSPFKNCLGTPRQGALAPSTRGRIEFFSFVSPECLDGLEGFSHLWILFLFHLNTNAATQLRAAAERGTKEGQGTAFTFPSKVSPPFLKKRVGIFSTRTPHRPNPIGITLAKIEAVDKKKRTVYISGLDLVEGTPVLDIKPYVHAYDAVGDASVPSWIEDGVPSRRNVTFSPEAEKQLLSLSLSSSSSFPSPSVLLSAVREVLSVDVRSKDQERKAKLSLSSLPFDDILVRFKTMENGDVRVESVEERERQTEGENRERKEREREREREIPEEAAGVASDGGEREKVEQDRGKSLVSERE